MKMPLTPASGTIEFVAIEILGPGLRTKSDSQLVFVVTEMKLTRNIPVATELLMNDVDVLVGTSVIPYRD